jgi:hypothetical protein
MLLNFEMGAIDENCEAQVLSAEVAKDLQERAVRMVSARRSRRAPRESEAPG